MINVKDYIQSKKDVTCMTLMINVKDYIQSKKDVKNYTV